MRTGSSGSTASATGAAGQHVLLPVVETQEILPRELALSEGGGALEERHVDHADVLGARASRRLSASPSAARTGSGSGRAGAAPRRCSGCASRAARAPPPTRRPRARCSHVSGTSCCSRSETYSVTQAWIPRLGARPRPQRGAVELVVRRPGACSSRPSRVSSAASRSIDVRSLIAISPSSRVDRHTARRAPRVPVGQRADTRRRPAARSPRRTGGPTICMPIGSPPAVKPHGTAQAGWPEKLNGRVKRIRAARTSDGAVAERRLALAHRRAPRSACGRQEHVAAGERLVDLVAHAAARTCWART